MAVDLISTYNPYPYAVPLPLGAAFCENPTLQARRLQRNPRRSSLYDASRAAELRLPVCIAPPSTANSSSLSHSRHPLRQHPHQKIGRKPSRGMRTFWRDDEDVQSLTLARNISQTSTTKTQSKDDDALTLRLPIQHTPSLPLHRHNRAASPSPTPSPATTTTSDGWLDMDLASPSGGDDTARPSLMPCPNDLRLCGITGTALDAFDQEQDREAFSDEEWEWSRIPATRGRRRRRDEDGEEEVTVFRGEDLLEGRLAINDAVEGRIDWVGKWMAA